MQALLFASRVRRRTTAAWDDCIGIPHARWMDARQRGGEGRTGPTQHHPGRPCDDGSAPSKRPVEPGQARLAVKEWYRDGTSVGTKVCLAGECVRNGQSRVDGSLRSIHHGRASSITWRRGGRHGAKVRPSTTMLARYRTPSVATIATERATDSVVEGLVDSHKWNLAPQRVTEIASLLPFF